MWSVHKDNPGDGSEQSIMRNWGAGVQLFPHKDNAVWRCSLVVGLTLDHHQAVIQSSVNESMV